MAGGFQVQCPDCGHEWSVATAWCKIGPGILMEPHNRAELYCPRCCLEVSYPKVIERKVWKGWYDDLTACPDSPPRFIRDVATQINACVDQANWYTSTKVQLCRVSCPMCEKPMEPLRDGDYRLECPRCGGRSTLLTHIESFISGLQGVPEGFT